MAAKPGVSYRYTIAFPRVWDGARPDWAADVIDRFLAIAGVIDASFPEFSAAWRAASSRGPRRESRRRLVYVQTNHPKQAAADSARDELLALTRQIKKELDAERVVVERAPVELEVL